MDTARITLITPTLVRLEYSEAGRFVDDPSLFASERGDWPSWRAGAGGQAIEVRTPSLRVVYRPDGRAFHAGNLEVEIAGGGSWRPGARQAGNLGGTVETLDTLTARVPLGEGLLSRDGWYLLDDSRRHVIRNGWVEARPEGAGIDWYLFAYGLDYRAALRSLGAIAGRVPMPRRHMLGSWYSRYWAYSAEDYRRIVREYDEHRTPLDVLVLDMDWHREGWCGWSWNRELIPDPDALLAELASRGVRTALNLHPFAGVGAHEDAYPAFMRALGREDAASRGEVVPYDAADRAYQAALFREVHEPIERRGVDFWWLDWQQEKFARSMPDLPNLAWLNRLYFEHASRDGRRGASFSRWGGWGDHRHPVHFSGDAHTGWEMLAFEVEMTASAGNVGCYYWSHDIGGHFGARNEELVTRWVQFGALSPVCRVHATCGLNLDRRPWLCAPALARAQEEAIRLRSEIFPSIYAGARRAWDEMIPLVRPMYLDHPRDEHAHHAPGQYMLAERLMVVPITSPGIGPSRVGTAPAWFPGGAKGGGWYRWSTGERHEPGEAIVSAAIDEVALFVPGGVPIVCQERTTRMGSTPLERMIVRCFPGEPGQVEAAAAYEDDGTTRGYERGEAAWTPIEARWTEEAGGWLGVEVRIGPRLGSYAGEPARTTCEVRIGAVDAIEDAASGAGPVASGVHEGEARLEVGEVARNDAGVRIVRARVRVRDHGAFARAERLRRGRLGMGQGARIGGGSVEGGTPGDGVRDVLRGVAPSGAACEIALGAGVRADERGARVIDPLGAMREGGGTLEIADVSGASRTLRTRRTLAEVGEAGGTIAPAGVLPALEEPTPGVVTRRLAEWKPEGAGSTIVRWELARRVRTLTRWRVVGPFDLDVSRPLETQALEPERVGREAGDGFGADRWYRVERGGKEEWLAWTRAIVAPDGQTINVWQSMGGRGKAAYLATHVRSHRAGRYTMSVEALEGFEAWVNGRKVASVSALGDTPSVSESAIDLEESWNRIVLKLATDSGWWFFRAWLDGSWAVDECVDP